MDNDARNILVIMSDLAAAEEVERLLTDEGHVVTVASTAGTALSQIPSLNPDLILLDLFLSDIGGYEVCRRIRLLGGRYIPLIMTGQGKNYRSLSRALLEGADDFIHRPFEREEFTARLIAALRWKEHQDRLERQTKALQDLTRLYQEQVVELQRMTDHLKEFSILDHITTLHHESYYYHRINEEVSKCERHGGGFSLMRMSVDNLSTLLKDAPKDSESQLLIEMGKVLSLELRTYDVPTRLGDSTLAALLQKASKTDAARLAHRLRSYMYRIAEKRPDLTREHQLEISVGIVEYPVDADNVLDLEIKLDQAMKAAQYEPEDTIFIFP